MPGFQPNCTGKSGHDRRGTSAAGGSQNCRQVSRDNQLGGELAGLMVSISKTPLWSASKVTAAGWPGVRVNLLS
jgi:hypothetical protein